MFSERDRGCKGRDVIFDVGPFTNSTRLGVLTHSLTHSLIHYLNEGIDETD